MKPFMPWINILAMSVALAVNGLANALPLNGKTTGAISDQFRVFFVPAAYVFAIWGVIYVGWIAFAIYQALPSQRNNPRLGRIGWLFVLASLANAAWLFAWHYELFPLSVVVMLSLLLLLIAIYVRLDVNRARVSAVERWTVDIPYSLYLGWISVATLANISGLLYYWRWDGWGIAPEVWAVILLAVALALGLAMALTRADVAFILVLIWAFAGIAVKQSATPLVATAASVAAALAVLLVPLAWTYVRRRRATAAA